MDVYIEIAFLNNFLITFVLLILTRYLLKLNDKKFKLILSAGFSTIVALILPLILLPTVLNFIAKLLVGILCICIAFKFKNAKQFIKQFGIFMMLTFIFGGLLTAFYEIFNLDLSSLKFGGSAYSFIVLSIFILLFAFYINIKKIASIINKHKQTSGFVYKTKLTINEKTFETNAFLDSGNRLKDKSTGQPVNIVTFSFISRFLSQDDIIALVKKDIESLKLNKAHFVEFSSVGASEQSMLVFQANSLEINDGKTNKKMNDALIGVIFRKFNDTIDYDILLSGESLT